MTLIEKLEALAKELDEWDEGTSPHRCAEEVRAIIAQEAAKPSAEPGLRDAFVQGAKWWEWEKAKATMWQSDQNGAWAEADRRAKDGSLGILDPLTRPAPADDIGRHSPDWEYRERAEALFREISSLKDGKYLRTTEDIINCIERALRRMVEREHIWMGYAPPPGDGALREAARRLATHPVVSGLSARIKDYALQHSERDPLEDVLTALARPAQTQGVEITSELDGTHRIDPPAP